MMKLRLTDDDGNEIAEYELGKDDGQWNVLNADEGQQLLSDIESAVWANEEPRSPTTWPRQP